MFCSMMFKNNTWVVVNGDLLKQQHALEEAESQLSLHQKRLSEIESKIRSILKEDELQVFLAAKSTYLNAFSQKKLTCKVEHNAYQQ
ncbi:hypothetical protein L1987_10286 [Smallanthus sonchifolius]|uniref:Uncharacterized protein n=1 Tax=Smallanthus sonchifolius TaxID=185202 RepID=A0ACB9JRN9_9ASTR|nr:hypothetical protein L1987_10286 [Smallanthus sonchifolius]